MECKNRNRKNIVFFLMRYEIASLITVRDKKHPALDGSHPTEKTRKKRSCRKYHRKNK